MSSSSQPDRSDETQSRLLHRAERDADRFNTNVAKLAGIVEQDTVWKAVILEQNLTNIDILTSQNRLTPREVDAVTNEGCTTILEETKELWVTILVTALAAIVQ
jgi:hypothetical protein